MYVEDVKPHGPTSFTKSLQTLDKDSDQLSNETEPWLFKKLIASIQVVFEVYALKVLFPSMKVLLSENESYCSWINETKDTGSPLALFIEANIPWPKPW